jgi:glycosyltransferase involved in cell wall biosynthesis
LYADVVYRGDGDHVYADRAFIVFVAGLAPRLGELVLFGRLQPEPGSSHYVLPSDGIRVAPLPYYSTLRDLRALARAVRGAKATFEAELDRLDAVLLFGPHPLSLLFTFWAWRRGVPVVQGVRQDWPRYMRGRLPSRAWLWAAWAADALDAIWRLLARRIPTVVVGTELGRRFRHARRLLVTGFSLVSDADIVRLADGNAPAWDGGALTVLGVTRLDAEKNALLLPEILALLRDDDPRWRFRVAGEGPLEAAVRRRAEELGVADHLELVGYVPTGAQLWELYRTSDAFLHVSLTEGLPQVVFEAQAAGTPIVATDVGGVAAALAGGEAGLLVPPRSAEAAAAALRRLRDEPELRVRLVARGLELVAEETMERQLDRLAQFVREAASARRGRRRPSRAS